MNLHNFICNETHLYALAYSIIFFTNSSTLLLKLMIYLLFCVLLGYDWP